MCHWKVETIELCMAGSGQKLVLKPNFWHTKILWQYSYRPKMTWSLTNVYSLLEGLAVHTTKIVKARMRRWGMVPSTRDSLLRPWLWSAQRCWIPSSMKLSRRKLLWFLRFCGYSRKSPNCRKFSVTNVSHYMVLQLKIIHTDGVPFAGPLSTSFDLMQHC